MADNTIPLVFTGVKFRYRRGNDVLSDINLSVKLGELVTVIGPNGAGKSTLLRLGAGILRPENGGVLLFGNAAHALPRREAARRVAYVSEIEPSELAPTVSEALLQAAYPHQPAWELFPKDAEDRLRHVLARLNLSPLAARPVGEISDGERKRVAIGRALMQDAPLMLLDEPAGHLDFAFQAELVKLLAEFKSAGRTIVVVEHNFLVSGRIADRVVLLNRGKVAAEGSPEKVLDGKILTSAYGAELDVIRHHDHHHVLLA